jgi:ribonuclease-3
MEITQGTLDIESPRDFAKRLGLPITDFLLLSRALTHRSYLNEHPEALEDNERLEFLGDAVLDFVVGAWLYNRFPEMSEGDMTRLRAALVRTEQLAEFGESIAIGRALRLGRGEEDGGGRTRPAMLCASFEALVGALYLDAKIKGVEDFMACMLEAASERILVSQEDKDPKSRLQEWAQSQGFSAPVYRIISEEGPDHAKNFEVEVVINGQIYASGKGRSKQDASKDAARAVLLKLNLY